MSQSDVNDGDQVAPGAADDQLEAEPDLPAEMFRSGGPAEETTIQMHKRIYGLLNVDVKFSEIDGMAVYEGDIMLGRADVVRGLDDPGPLGIGIVGAEYRWPNGVVPYVTQDVLAPTVKAAITHWEQNTPIRFIQRSDQEDYISFEEQGGCWSEVGRRGGRQVVSLGLGCGVKSAIHEIGHLLGLWHEQSRSDRDDFVQIITENIDPEQEYNFEKHILDAEDIGPYDYVSIMHYPSLAFSINDEPTILKKDGSPLPPRKGLSEGDIAAIRFMYPNLNWPQS